MFNIVALHAVMADLLSGDTIHPAVSLPVFATDGSKPSGDKSEINTMKASLQFICLIIDAIRVARARLLADIDTKLRSCARAVKTVCHRCKKQRATICRSQYFV